MAPMAVVSGGGTVALGGEALGPTFLSPYITTCWPVSMPSLPPCSPESSCETRLYTCTTEHGRARQSTAGPIQPDRRGGGTEAVRAGAWRLTIAVTVR